MPPTGHKRLILEHYKIHYPGGGGGGYPHDGLYGKALPERASFVSIEVYTAVSTKVVQKSVKVYATMPQGSLGNTQQISIKSHNP